MTKHITSGIIFGAMGIGIGLAIGIAASGAWQAISGSGRSK